MVGDSIGIGGGVCIGGGGFGVCDGFCSGIVTLVQPVSVLFLRVFVIVV